MRYLTWLNVNCSNPVYFCINVRISRGCKKKSTAVVHKKWRSKFHKIFQIHELLPSKHLLVLKTSSTRPQRNKFRSSKKSWRYLAKTPSGRLEDILQDVVKTSGKTKNCYAEDNWRIVKTCLEDALKAGLEDVLKDVLKTLWSQIKPLLGISVSNKSKYVSNKFIFHKSIFDNSRTNTKYIN